MNARLLLLVSIGLLCSGVSASHRPEKATDFGIVAASSRPQQIKALSTLPLSFEANQGQADPHVRFLSRSAGHTVFLTPTEAVLVPNNSGTGDRGASGKARTPQPRASVLRMKLFGANPSPQLSGLDELPGKSNYFIGKDPKGWYTNVPNYAKVKYKGIYPGVDLVYYGNQHQLEYDFVIAPGATPKSIVLNIDGADRIKTDARGDLVVRTGSDEVRFHKPIVYQPLENGSPSDLASIADGSTKSCHPSSTRHEVNGQYVLRDKRRVLFKVAAYDHSKPLIIDPVLSYSTYLGGSGEELAFPLVVDSSGDAYVAGNTNSPNFPITPGAFDTTCGTDGNCNPTPTGRLRSDAFVTKLNATGTALIYSTFLGGSSGDDARGLAVDSSGNAYVAGTTSSVDFPVTSGAFQTACNTAPGYCSGDIFVAKLNASGNVLLYSTYLGGSGDDEGRSLGLDNSGNVYVTGLTESTDFPVTLGAFQTVSGGGTCGVAPNTFPCDHAFVAKLNPAGNGLSDLAYSTYLGGNSEDIGWAIAVDVSGIAYVAGQTTSTDFPTTAGAFQLSYGGGGGNVCVATSIFCGDAFVAKLQPAGNSTGDLLYSTYLGGIGDDSAGFSGVTVDSVGDIYLTGTTSSTNFPATIGAFQTGCGGACGNGNHSGFVAKLDPFQSGAASLVYSTYLGKSLGTASLAITVDSTGHAFVNGSTSSTDFPTASPIQATLAACPPSNTLSCQDSIVTVLNTNGSGLLFSTYLGGSGYEQGNGVAIDQFGSIYVAGLTSSPDFPLTSAAFQTTYGGGVFDGYVAKIVPFVHFPSFSAKLDIGKGPPPSFEVTATLVLGPGSNGINPLNENVTLEIGTFAVTVPAGSFTKNKKGAFNFQGAINGVSLEEHIVPITSNSFSFTAQGTGVDLTGVPNPVMVSLTIGDDNGNTQVIPDFE